MRDFFFQIVLFLGGAAIGIAAPLLQRPGQKKVAGILAILLVIISLVWAGYELGIRETSSTDATSITPDINDSTLYDDFNNPAFDGGWNIGLWEPNDVSACKIVQQEGYLSFSCTDPSKSPSFNARRLGDLKFGDFSFIEARLMLNYKTQPAYGGVIFGIETSDTPSWGIACGIIGRNQESLAQTYCWVYPAEKFIDGPRVNYNTWHVVRVEVNPESAQLKLFVDGEETATYTPPEADSLKQAKFHVSLSSYSEGKNGTLITGYIDDVRIGQ